MCLVITLLLTITMGVIEYSWFFLKQQQLVNAARQGARIASIDGATNAQVTSAVSTAMDSYGMGTAKTGYTLTITPDNLSGAQRGQTVTVKIAVPYSSISITKITADWVLPVIKQDQSISATISMQREGP